MTEDDGPDWWQQQEALEALEALEAYEQMRNRNASKTEKVRGHGPSDDRELKNLG